jgi:hypothetical protein
MQPLIEEIDFYVEEGKLVLTEKYLLERGYCCGNGCRHCPYILKDIPGKNIDSNKSPINSNISGHGDMD